MNILMIAPTHLDETQQPIKYRKAFLPPLSLATLDSLTPSCHNVTIVNDVVEKVDYSGAYDLVCITAMTPQSERAYQISAKFRARGVTVILGGMHPTILPEEAQEHADAIVVGEADDIWESVLDDCENNRLQKVYQSEQLPNLSRRVIPNWDNMNMDIYPRKQGAKKPMMPIFTTRGCPYGCSFCTVSRFFGKRYRTKPIEHVLAEIECTNAENLFFVDDNVGGHPDYSRELFASLYDKNLTWFSQISTRVLNTPDLLGKAARAGCNALFVGVESVNEDSLKGSNKSFNKVDKYGELVKLMKAVGIVPYFSFIFGFDEDTPEQFERTIEFLKKHDVTRSIFWILTPIPGTELFETMDAENRIIDKRWSSYDGTHVVYQPKSFAADELVDLFWKSFQSMYTLRQHINAIAQSVRITNKHPLKAVLEAMFFRLYFGQKVRAREHPFSAGFGRRCPADKSTIS